jgi:hypothetical protein
MRRSIAVALILAPFVAPTSAAATPLWQLILRHQMMVEQRCRTDHLEEIMEHRDGDGVRLTTKVLCDDGRVFYAEWNLKERRFDIRPRAHARPSPHAAE